jgi:hypothetical protein
MTEAEWLACENWQPLLAHLAGRVSHRKGPLYICAGLRQLWDLLYDVASRRAVDVIERAADGSVAEAEVHRALWDAESPTFGYDFMRRYAREWFAGEGQDCDRVSTLMRMGIYRKEDLQGDDRFLLGDERYRTRLLNAAHIAFHANMVMDGKISGHTLEHLAKQEEWPGGWLVREVFGNPFCTAVTDPSWLSWNGGTVLKLAQAIYEERQIPAGHFDIARLAVLADALEEAGCTDANLLAHLRGPGPHVRGCWVLDLLLGKE